MDASGESAHQEVASVNSLSFPEDFLWGVATSGHQVEGNNTASDWWAWEPGKIEGGLTSGRACDAWNRYEEDYATMKSMGLNAYRMGIEWARVEPRPGMWDDAVFAHYEAMMESLSEKGIAICLTLYHWVLPKWVADQDGWENPATCDAFLRFVQEVVNRLGKYPLLWCTLNEPNVYTMFSYVTGEFPPEKRSLRAARRVTRHLLTAHAGAYSIICEGGSKSADPNSRPLIGIAHNMTDFAPASHSPFDRAIAKYQSKSWNSSYIEALVTGRMPGPFGDGKPIPGLAGSLTYMGLNYYTRRTVAFRPNGISNAFSQEVFPKGTELNDFGWAVCPEGIYNCLVELGKLRIPVYITENGVADANDSMRPRYIVEHLREVWRAIGSGVDVRGYFYWTFQDNFEWRAGYTQKFGLFELDPTDPNLQRTPRRSAEMYAKIAKANGITESISTKYLGK